ncbi:MAG TPA: PEGA domain-containing protein [Drouetiella sp.]
MNTYNFVVTTDSDDIGAEVIVDKQKIGAVSKSTADGPGGGVFMGYLPRGKHTVEVHKEGYKPYTREFDMLQEQYLGVDLQAQSN